VADVGRLLQVPVIGNHNAGLSLQETGTKQDNIAQYVISMTTSPAQRLITHLDGLNDEADRIRVVLCGRNTGGTHGIT